MVTLVLTKLFREIAYKAFYQHDQDCWRIIQCLLYHWNCESFQRRADAFDLAHNVKMILRNYLLNMEFTALQQQAPIQLNCKDHFTVDTAIEELREKAGQHRIN